MSQEDDLCRKTPSWRHLAVVPLICALVAASPMQMISAHAIDPPAATAQVLRPSRLEDLDYARSVDDRARVIDVDSTRAIRLIIEDADERFGSEVIVLTLDSIEGGKPAAKEFTTTLFNRWGVGNAERNNGVLILFSKNDRRVEIAVGKKLNHLMSTTWTTDMLADDVLPILKTGDYGAGLTRATERILQRLEKGDAGVAADERASAGVLGGGAAALALAGIQADRKFRTCENCGAIVPEKFISDWKTVLTATDRREGLSKKRLSCQVCGKVTHKTRTISRYDGVDANGNYYYESSSSGSSGSDYGSGSSDGGGGGGGDF